MRGRRARSTETGRFSSDCGCRQTVGRRPSCNRGVSRSGKSAVYPTGESERRGAPEERLASWQPLEDVLGIARSVRAPCVEAVDPVIQAEADLVPRASARRRFPPLLRGSTPHSFFSVSGLVDELDDVHAGVEISAPSPPLRVPCHQRNSFSYSGTDLRMNGPRREPRAGISFVDPILRGDVLERRYEGGANVTRVEMASGRRHDLSGTSPVRGTSDRSHRVRRSLGDVQSASPWITVIRGCRSRDASGNRDPSGAESGVRSRDEMTPSRWEAPRIRRRCGPRRVQA